MKLKIPLKKQYNKTLIAVLTIFIISCSNNNSEYVKMWFPEKDTIQKDTVKEVVVKEKKIDSTIIVNRFLDDMASYIAGMQPFEMDSVMLKKNVWKNYSQNIQKNWLKTDSTCIRKIKEWSRSELSDINEKSKTIFYPFSGADFLNAYAFFPSAKNYILIGLEPVGTLPDITTETHADSLANYFYKINQSLYAILNFSFFITKSMKVDFKNKDLDGAIHLILIFMKRSGNAIVNIKPIALARDGKVVSYATFQDSKNDTLSNRGVEIDFVDSDSVLKKTYYFSVNLADQPFNKNQSFVNFINLQEGEITTYVKSASYLMHKNHFSFVRNLILEKSDAVLEDDSGIPIKYFNDSIWNTSLYGTYSGTIPMFSAFVQKDLKNDYDSLATKQLDFGIGYKYKTGQSNLLLLKKNKN